jgi:translation elongation factor aEF-1 beta
MGLVAITYKIMGADGDTDIEAVADRVRGLNNDVFDIQAVELKPLAFGLRFIQLHVVMDDGEGLVDSFEEKVKSVGDVGEVEVLEIGLL